MFVLLPRINYALTQPAQKATGYAGSRLVIAPRGRERERIVVVVVVAVVVVVDSVAGGSSSSSSSSSSKAPRAVQDWGRRALQWI